MSTSFSVVKIPTCQDNSYGQQSAAAVWTLQLAPRQSLLWVNPTDSHEGKELALARVALQELPFDGGKLFEDISNDSIDIAKKSLKSAIPKSYGATVIRELCAIENP
jgi:hypothetical protein